MPKRTISFKPTPECETQLAELMDRWKCNRTQALNKAINLAHAALTTRVVPSRGAAEQAELGKRPNAREQQESTISRIDPDKIAAFQRKAGMGGAGKRK